jgi:hypothetical protein
LCEWRKLWLQAMLRATINESMKAADIVHEQVSTVARCTGAQKSAHTRLRHAGNGVGVP